MRPVYRPRSRERQSSLDHFPHRVASALDDALFWIEQTGGVFGAARLMTLYRCCETQKMLEANERRRGRFSRKGASRLFLLAFAGIWSTAALCGSSASAAAENDAPPRAAEVTFWSLKIPVRPPVPASGESGTAQNPIDAFLFARLRERGLAIAPAADKRTLIRRASFDLIGLPPAPERVEQFVSDGAADAYEKLLDELLASPQYGERWGRHWLDLARYADSGGYETDDYFRHAWRYRDYVVQSFNDDKPYDRFVQEQLAGDELWPDNLDLDGNYVMAPDKLKHLEARIGTGLFALGPQIHESNMDARKLLYEQFSDWVDTTGSIFMGLTLGCARCHDHKFDPITQHDYFGLQAAFAGSKETEIPLINGMELADFKQHYPRILAIDEARKAYRLFERKVAGRELTPPERDEQRQLLEAIARAVLALP